MSIENVKAFYEVVMNDQDLQTQISQLVQSNPQEVVAEVIKLAGEKGYDFIDSEFKTFADGLAAARLKNGELSDGELEAVAGGGKFSSIIDSTTKIGYIVWLQLLDKGTVEIADWDGMTSALCQGDS